MAMSRVSITYKSRRRFVRFFGQKTSRSNRHKRIYEGGTSGHERVTLMCLLSPFVLSLSDVHLRELRKVCVDEPV